jgi:RNA polymerase sigma-70 factor (ECF subfamily)
MDEDQWLADRFEEHRPRLRAVAYRMLGSLAEADDAVQDAWLRLNSSGAGEIANLGGWLTTVMARVWLNMLRSRSLRREEPLGVGVRGPLIGPQGEQQPEQEALVADSVGLALQVVLDTLTPTSGSRSCCMTCSNCRSTRSPRWSAGPRPRPGSWPAGHAAG